MVSQRKLTPNHGSLFMGRGQIIGGNKGCEGCRVAKDAKQKIDCEILMFFATFAAFATFATL